MDILPASACGPPWLSIGYVSPAPEIRRLCSVSPTWLIVGDISAAAKFTLCLASTECARNEQAMMCEALRTYFHLIPALVSTYPLVPQLLSVAIFGVQENSLSSKLVSTTVSIYLYDNLQCTVLCGLPECLIRLLHLTELEI